MSIRVAGPVTTEAFAHHFGTSEQQVGVRAGDTLTYVHGAEAATAVARVFSDAVARAEAEQLRYSVSPTWLGIESGQYPPTLMQRYVTAPATSLGYQPRRVISGQVVPAHVWVRVGPVLWQVCDRYAADRLAHVWSSCARLLTPSSAPAVPRARTRAERPSQMAPERPTTTPRRPFSRTTAMSDPREDAELLIAHAAGDAEALPVLIVRREEWVKAAVRRVLSSRADADDAVQNAWMNVARGAVAFEGRAAVSTWLWRIAYRSAIDVLRRSQLVLPADPSVADPDDAHGRAERTIVVGELLSVLPAAQRAAVELVDLQGYDFHTAAGLLGVAEGTVKSRCHRGREAMAVEAARRGLHVQS